MSGLAKWKVRIDSKDIQQMAALTVPILLLLAVDYMFQDFWDSLNPEMRWVTFFALLAATAFAYQRLIKRWFK